MVVQVAKHTLSNQVSSFLLSQPIRKFYSLCTPMINDQKLMFAICPGHKIYPVRTEKCLIRAPQVFSPHESPECCQLIIKSSRPPLTISNSESIPGESSINLPISLTSNFLPSGTGNRYSGFLKPQYGVILCSGSQVTSPS